MPPLKLDKDLLIPASLVIAALGFTASGTWIVTDKMSQLTHTVADLTRAVERLSGQAWTFADQQAWVRLSKTSYPQLPEPVQVSR